MPMPFCTPAVRPTAPKDFAEQHIAELWVSPDVLNEDVFTGPWGSEHAPDPAATYTFVRAKTHGVSPGLTVRDPHGVEWSVKQGDEGPVEVTLSRLLSAVGYHQPPVYFIPAFTLVDEHGRAHMSGGGRFRPHEKGLKDLGEWSWQENPFVGTRPYQGLLVILMMLDSSDLKNSNNTLYELKQPRGGVSRWYVVRDIGTGLGETARLDPKRNDPDIFARHKFISGVHNGFVEFSYHGWHQELFKNRITPDDVHWACNLLGKLSASQWRDVFRAGGYDPDVAQRFIDKLQEKINEGRQVE
jgi:hypothetical protein